MLQRSPAAVRATVNSAFAKPLVVKVTDQYGNAVTGVNVKFSASGKKCQRQFQQRHNPDYGHDGATGQPVGDVHRQHRGRPYSVTASVAGVSTPASFSLTNNPAAAASITVISAGGQTATVDSDFD